MTVPESEQAAAIAKQARDWKTMAEGLRAAIDIHMCGYYALQGEKARVEGELASARSELAALRLWFAQAKSQGADVPEALTVRQLDKWRKLK